MNKKLSLEILSELLWWSATFIVAALVLLPIYGTIANANLKLNLIMIVVSLTCFRYIIFLNQVPYLSLLPTRVALIILVALGFWQFMTQLQHFMFVVDNYTISTFLVPDKSFVDSEAQQAAFIYFKREYLLFNLSVLILSVVLIFRTIGSLWKLGKKG